jgi:hypothetical protein
MVIYIGNILSGKAHGEGMKTYLDGSKFEGEFKNDRPYKGVVIYPNGNKLTGNWIDMNTFQGKMEYLDRRIFEVEWQNGKIYYNKLFETYQNTRCPDKNIVKEYKNGKEVKYNKKRKINNDDCANALLLLRSI